MRLFVAIWPEVRVKGRLLEIQQELRPLTGNIKWVEPGNLHLTLHFLGDVEDPGMVTDGLQLAARRHHPFVISLGGLGAFPRTGRPQVLWVGVSMGVDQLDKLFQLTLPVAREYGQRAGCSLAAHLTLGRLRRGSDPEPLQRLLADKQGVKVGEQRVDEITLVASKLSPQGPSYTIISRHPLG